MDFNVQYQASAVRYELMCSNRRAYNGESKQMN